MLIAVYDGHAGPRAAEKCAESLPAAVFKDLVNLEVDGEQVYCLEAPEDVLLQEVTKRVIAFDQSFINDFDDGCTACMVIAQPWDLVNDKAITTPIANDSTQFSFANRDQIGLKLLCFNVGDSRAVLFPYQSQTPVKLSDDHKPESAVEKNRIMGCGGFVEMGRVDGNLAVSRAFGDAPYKRTPSRAPEDQKVVPVPDLTTAIAKYGDLLLVACDGIYEVDGMTREAVGALLFDHKKELVEYWKGAKELTQDDAEIDELLYSPAEIGRAIIQESIAAGSNDNHTAMVISFTSYNTAIEKLQKEQPEAPALAYLKEQVESSRLEIVLGYYPDADETMLQTDIAHSHLQKLAENDTVWDDVLPAQEQADAIAAVKETDPNAEDDEVVPTRAFRTIYPPHVLNVDQLHHNFNAHKFNETTAATVEFLDAVNAKLVHKKLATTPILLYPAAKSDDDNDGEGGQFSQNELLQLLLRQHMMGGGQMPPGLEEDDY